MARGRSDGLLHCENRKTTEDSSPAMALALSGWVPAARQQWPSASVSSAHLAAPQAWFCTKTIPRPPHPHFLAWSSPASTSWGDILAAAVIVAENAGSCIRHAVAFWGR